jgi:tRNA threonylcarbamoyladenosine modification (KEOPS) complex  Pcc1 subunit
MYRNELGAMRRYYAVLKLERIKGLDYKKFFDKKYSYKRSSIRIKGTSSKIVFEISAEDPTALRASINSLLGDIQVIEAVSKTPHRKS